MIKDLVAFIGKSEYVFQCTFTTLFVIYSPFFLSPVHSNMLQCILCRRLFHVGKFPLQCSVRLTKGLISFL